MYEVSFPFLLAGARLFNIFQPAVYLRNFSLGLSRLFISLISLSIFFSVCALLSMFAAVSILLLVLLFARLSFI